MKVDLREVGDVTVAALEGRLAGGAGDIVLREVINDLLAQGRKKILLDLSGVPSIDSSGIGELVLSQKVAQELNAEIRILRATEGVQRVLSMVQILPLFEIHRTEAEALEGFAEG